MTWQIPTNWYWNVQDTSPGTQNWQSFSGAFVGFADADYVSFLAAGYIPTGIDTFANLMAEIDSYNQRLWAGGQLNGVANRTFNANVTLTNPMLLTQEFTAGSTHSVTLPIMNVPGSIPKGVPFVIYANGPYRTFSVLVRAQDGTLLYTANGGQVLTLLLIDNSTQNGTFVETAVTQPTPLPPQLGGTGQATLTSFGVLIGEGTGSVNSVVLDDAQLLVGQTSADPLPKTVSGDATLAASGALTVTGINGVDQTVAWTTYTPTVSSGAGSLTTASATGRYQVIGKTVFCQITVSITTNGTGAQSVMATLPFAPKSGERYGFTGRENDVTGKQLIGVPVSVGSSTLFIVNYDNTYPGGDGTNLVLSGVYEQD